METINLGKWSEGDLERIMAAASHIKSTGERIAFISAHFLNTPYLESTLAGGFDEEEVYAINFAGVDCFTFIDYVEAMRISVSFKEFTENLKSVRYQGGKVEYVKRNHFFTDWAEFNGSNVQDATTLIGGKNAKRITKTLNINNVGEFILKGVTPKEREISYIPVCNIDFSIISSMNNGDYFGIYSELPGLDVSHVGIIIKKDNGETLLRHASSVERYRKVVDQPLMDYLHGKTGLIILRPLPL